MTLILEAPATTDVAERPVQPRDNEPPTSWAATAARAHAFLSQTMPDEEIDELVAAAAWSDRTISLPPVLFG
jgi:hypothetical protein